MVKPATKVFPQSRLLVAAIALGLVLAVGVVDYLTGYEISFSIFYLLAISFALWYANILFAVFIAALSIISWLVGDWAAGVVYPNRFVPIWNALITFGSYLIIIWLLARLKTFNRTLEARIRQRTAALAAEIEERRRLENELLVVSEREQQRIGHDLHDGLCQHLTGTALAGQVLGEKLAARQSPETADANHIVQLIEQGITIARNLARGLFPVKIEAEGLIAALEELAAGNAERSKVECSFESGEPAIIHDTFVATHLYRIAQEAVRNALNHSGARHIAITLEKTAAGARLAVKDDGHGMGNPPQTAKGMGLHIMRHRAAMIDASFNIQSDSLGTVISCDIADAPPAKNSLS